MDYKDEQLLSQRQLTCNLQNFFLKELVDDIQLFFLIVGLLIKLVVNLNSSYLTDRNLGGFAQTSAANLEQSGTKHVVSFVGSMFCLIYLYFAVLKLFGLFKHKNLRKEKSVTVKMQFEWKKVFSSRMMLSFCVMGVCVLFLWIMIGVYNSSPELNQNITCQLVFSNNATQSKLRSICSCRFNASMIFDKGFEHCQQYFSKVVSPAKLALIGVLTGALIKISNQLNRIFENVTIQMGLSLMATALYMFITFVSIETPKDRYQTNYFDIGLNVDNFVFLRFFSRIWHYCFSYYFKLLVTTTQLVSLFRAFFDIGSENQHKLVQLWTDLLVAFVGSGSDPGVLLIFVGGSVLKYNLIRWRYSRNENEMVICNKQALRQINPFENFQKRDFHCFFLLLLLATFAHVASCFLLIFRLPPPLPWLNLGFESVAAGIVVCCLVRKAMEVGLLGEESKGKRADESRLNVDNQSEQVILDQNQNQQLIQDM